MMFDVNTYPTVCHVCGERGEVEAEFLAGDTRWDERDGIWRTLRACPGKHTAAEIRAAWEDHCAGRPGRNR